MKAGDKIELLDKTETVLGHIEVQEETHGVLCGEFSPGPGYAAVRPLFEQFASLVDQQCFALLDPVEEKIEELGVFGKFGGAKLPLFDLQIFDHAASVRLRTISH